MQTTISRDAQIVAWLGRLGAAGAQHVSERFGISFSWARARLARLVADGLLVHRMVLYAKPGLYSATRRGLHWQGLHGIPVFPVSPGGFEHAWRMASTAVALGRELPDWRLIAEREIRLLHTDRDQPIAWAKVGSVGSRQAYHRPDFVLISPAGRVVVVEVELTPKDPRRLRKICRGWARSRHVEHAYYLAGKKAGEAVGRAVEVVQVGDLITILEVADVPGLARRELQIVASATDRAARTHPGGHMAAKEVCDVRVA